MNYVAIIFILYSILPILHHYKLKDVAVVIWIFVADLWAFQAIGAI